MEIKMIKVQKGLVTKEVEARQEKDYVKNGWIVVKTINPFEPKTTLISPYGKR